MPDLDRELIYVGDPMCSWCWGIAPEIDRLSSELPAVPLRVVTGGLRPGRYAQELTDAFVEFLSHEWRQINAYTGQPFDFSILQRRDWLYDTEPACRAVSLMRELDEPLAWPLFKRIQRAFYAQGIVVSTPDSYRRLVEEIGGNSGKFMELFESEQARASAQEDFATARSWGITAFPAVLLRVGSEGHIIARGYARAEQMLDLVGSIRS